MKNRTTATQENHYCMLTSSPRKQSSTHNQIDTLNKLLTTGAVWCATTSGDEVTTTGSFSCRSDTQPAKKPVISFNAPEIDSLLPHGGLLCGAIHEFFYNDPLLSASTRPQENLSFPRTIPALLTRNAIQSYYDSPTNAWDQRHSHSTSAFPFFIVWIGRRSWPTPFALSKESLDSSLFIDPPTERLTLWSIETALRSHAVKLVIADCPSLSLTTSRRFLLAAESHNTTALLLRPSKDINTPSSATTRWQLSPIPDPSQIHPTWELSLKRLKGGALATSSTTTWLLGLQEHSYEEAREREAVSLRVLSRVVDRGNQTQTPSYAPQYGT